MTTPATPGTSAEAPPAATATGAPAGAPPPAQVVPPAGGAGEKPAEQAPEQKVELTAEQKAEAEKKAAADVEAKKAEEVKAAEAKKLADEKTAKEAAEKKAKDDKDAFDKSWADYKPPHVPGVVRPDADVKKFVEAAKAAGLTPEKAAPFIELHDSMQKGAQAAREQALKVEREGWIGALKKEAGSDRAFDVMQRTANKAFDAYADEETRAFLKVTGLDAHPGLLKFAHRVGLAMANDSISGSEPTGAGSKTPTKQERINALYSNTKFTT